MFIIIKINLYKTITVVVYFIKCRYMVQSMCLYLKVRICWTIFWDNLRSSVYLNLVLRTLACTREKFRFAEHIWRKIAKSSLPELLVGYVDLYVQKKFGFAKFSESSFPELQCWRQTRFRLLSDYFRKVLNHDEILTPILAK